MRVGEVGVDIRGRAGNKGGIVMLELQGTTGCDRHYRSRVWEGAIRAESASRVSKTLALSWQLEGPPTRADVPAASSCCWAAQHKHAMVAALCCYFCVCLLLRAHLIDLAPCV